jgi:hypothetical protein
MDEVDEQLIGRVEKLEKDLGALDELFDGFNLSALKVHSDFEKRIKALESVITHTIPYPEQVINDNKQANNPLTKEEIECLDQALKFFYKDAPLQYEIILQKKLASYLEK